MRASKIKVTDEIQRHLRDFEEVEEGPPCPRGCYNNGVQEPSYEVYRRPNERLTVRHDCQRRPEKLLTLLLERIGSWTLAAWDQHARYEAGDQATDDLIEWLKEKGIEPYRGRD